MRVTSQVSARDTDPPSATEVARLVDEVGNGLQVILGYAQILHELEGAERDRAVGLIADECTHLRGLMSSLTSSARDPDGRGTWSEPAP